MNKIFGILQKAAENVYSIIASTNDVDRDGEIIEPSAFKNLKDYLGKNPVILWAHDYSKPPVGKAISGRINKNSVVLDIEFADTEFGREVKYLYDNGFMSSFSVGFIPKHWDTDEKGRVVFTDAELLEVSAVPVPANAAANVIRSAKSKGVALEKIESIYQDVTEEDVAASESSKMDDGATDTGPNATVKRRQIINGGWKWTH